MDTRVCGQYIWTLEKVFDPDPTIQHITKYKNGILSIDDISVYEFNEADGKLKISMSKKDLEYFISQMGFIAEKGENLVMRTPPTMSHDYPTITFKGVRSIQSLDPVNGNYMMEYEPLHPIPENKIGIEQNVNSYFKREHKN